MRRFWLFLRIFPVLCFSPCWGDAPDWKAKSEVEALFLRRIADFWQEGEYQIAKSQMEEFLAAFPDSAFSDPLCAALGDLFLREKNYSSALNYYAIVASGDLFSQIFLNRMQCLYYMEWYATLADECEAYLQREELESSQKLQTTYYLAIALYQQCLNASHEPEILLKLAQRAQPHFEMIFQSELNGEVAAAFAHLSCILKDYPKASAIYLGLAKQDPEGEEEMLFQAALIQAEYDKELAAKTFDEIAQKGKNKAKEAAYNRLVLCFEAGQYEKILDQRENLMSQLPPDRAGMAHLFLGRSFLAMKKYAEASGEFKSYLSDAPPAETLRGALLSLIDSSFRSDDLASLDFALAKLSSDFPNDAEIPKGRFSLALVLKKGQRVDDARQVLEDLLASHPHFAEAPQASFELAHLDYHRKAWISCREKSRAFLSQFPDHDLAPFAWRYLISSSAEMSAERPKNKELKEQLAFDIETLLRQEKLLSSRERCDWQFLLAKTNFELGCYEEAMSALQALAGSNIPFSEEPNANLLMALCYRDGLGDLVHFCSFAERAIEKKADLMDLGSLHASLFNAYLTLSHGDEKWMGNAADHLFAAFENNAHIQTENVLWLADHFYSCLKIEEESPSLPTVQKVVALFEYLLNPCEILKEDSLFLEPAFCKLGKLYQLLQRHEEAISLFLKLSAQHRASPSLTWKCETEASLLLAESYAAVGKTEGAILLFDSIAKEKSTLRTTFGASACLQSARLRWLQQTSTPDNGRFHQILAQLKDLVLQKTLPNEPLHLEAALDYIDLQTQFDPDPRKKRLALLVKTKESFESVADLLSKDYHEARARLPRKNQIYEGYMRLMEAEILAVKSTLSEGLEMRKELQAKAQDLLLQIVNEKAHSALVARARKRLENVPVTEQKA